ncbi:hypothetical protein QBC39DRAFT_182036 [Podospora conica]|nr:hypothetical protein QBC39DRAFT_182036 [Schizothecium conicum]
MSLLHHVAPCQSPSQHHSSPRGTGQHFHRLTDLAPSSGPQIQPESTERPLYKNQWHQCPCSTGSGVFFTRTQIETATSWLDPLRKIFSKQPASSFCCYDIAPANGGPIPSGPPGQTVTLTLDWCTAGTQPGAHRDSARPTPKRDGMKLSRPRTKRAWTMPSRRAPAEGSPDSRPGSDDGGRLAQSSHGPRRAKNRHSDVARFQWSIAIPERAPG